MRIKWNGDADGSVRSISQYDITFPVGEFVDVPDEHPMAAKLKGNSRFTVEDSDGPVDQATPAKADKKAKAS